MKRYDIILYGATGFTGKQVVAYFSKHAPIAVRWAIAGRNQQKLEAVQADLDLAVDIIVADAQDTATIDDMVQQTAVILTTAGPYALYGTNLLANCAKHGVHYVDITGEAPWVAKMLQQYGDQAKTTGAKIIPFCGFDSIPADLGLGQLQAYARATWQEELVEAKSYYTMARGGLNGGTLLSGLNMMETGEGAMLMNPYLLTKDLQVPKFISKIKDSDKHHYVAALKRWVYPFFMADINSKVVYRSVGLAIHHELAHPPTFYYNEYHAIGKRWAAFMGATILRSINTLGRFAVVRKLMKRFGPDAGEGPSEDDREEGFFRLRMFGKTSSGQQAMMQLQYPGDAGNKATVCFLCESALALCLQLDELPDRKGFLTPQMAFGDVLVARLKAAGLELTCETVQ